jgi:hypothetical protein
LEGEKGKMKTPSVHEMHFLKEKIDQLKEQGVYRKLPKHSIKIPLILYSTEKNQESKASILKGRGHFFSVSGQGSTSLILWRKMGYL